MHSRSWLALSVIAAASLAAAEGTVFEIPKLNEISIDGKSGDWGARGLTVENLKDVNGKARDAKNFNAVFRLGWDERGLLILATVTDDVASEPAEKNEEIWKGDSIELFASPLKGTNATYQVVVAPGRDAKHADMRQNISDYRKELEGKKEKLAIEAARSTSDTGYVLEVLLPWKNLNVDAAEGREVALQLYANDLDNDGERFQVLWFPKADTHNDPANMHRIKLANAAGAAATPPAAKDAATPPEFTTKAPTPAAPKVSFIGSYDGDGRGWVTVTAGAEMKGKSIRVKDGEKVVGKGKFEIEGDRALAKVKLDKSKNKNYETLSVTADDEVIGSVRMP